MVTDLEEGRQIFSAYGAWKNDNNGQRAICLTEPLKPQEFEVPYTRAGWVHR